jgi:hypothetical protein
MKITAYKCDVCKAIVEEPSFNLCSDYDWDFSIKSFRSYRNDNCACSSDCAKAALDAWIEGQKKVPEPSVSEFTKSMDAVEAHLEPETVVLNGEQPS